MRKGDIYSWRYNPERLEKLNHGNNGGTTYWCCSQIAVWNGDRLVDTYWTNGNRSLSFDKANILKNLKLEFLANEKRITKINKGDTIYYREKDIVNLTHANSYGSKVYLRNGAKKSIKKMRSVLLRHIEDAERRKENATSDAERFTKILKNLTIESYLPCNVDI